MLMNHHPVRRIPNLGHLHTILEYLILVSSIECVSSSASVYKSGFSIWERI